MTIEDAAKRVKNNIEGDSQVFIDPASIMLMASIISAILSAIRLYCQWKKNKQDAQKLVDGSKEPGLIGYFILKRTVRKHLGRERFKTDGQKVIDAILKSGSQLSIEEAENLLGLS